jgi:hypothetical protein
MRQHSALSSVMRSPTVFVMRGLEPRIYPVVGAPGGPGRTNG